MDARSESMPTHRDGSRLSSSLPQSTWLQGSSVSAASSSVSHAVNQRQGESIHVLDESTLARRTTALRQLHGNPRPLSRRPRDNKPISGRSSTLASQPVLVRSYSPGPDESQSSPNMSSDSASRQIEMPSVDEFSIDSILRAIEPDIRSTLDSIAEICGRSKLSLANEYGSHIAPFGEIHDPSGGLVTVEEASITSERLANVNDNVAIVDDENEHYSSTMGLLENLRQTAFATGYQRIRRAQNENQTNPESSRQHNAVNTETASSLIPKGRMEAFSKTPKPASKTLLASASASLPTNIKQQSKITSPALLSETRLEAQGNRSSWPSVPPDTPQSSPILQSTSFPINGQGSHRNRLVDKPSFIVEVQAWLGWLKTVVQREKTSQHRAHSQSHSAELTLRAVLERDQDHGIAVPSA